MPLIQFLVTRLLPVTRVTTMSVSTSQPAGRDPISVIVSDIDVGGEVHRYSRATQAQVLAHPRMLARLDLLAPSVRTGWSGMARTGYERIRHFASQAGWRSGANKHRLPALAACVIDGPAEHRAAALDKLSSVIRRSIRNKAADHGPASAALCILAEHLPELPQDLQEACTVLFSDECFELLPRSARRKISEALLRALPATQYSLVQKRILCAIRPVLEQIPQAFHSDRLCKLVQSRSALSPQAATEALDLAFDFAQLMQPNERVRIFRSMLRSPPLAWDMLENIDAATTNRVKELLRTPGCRDALEHQQFTKLYIDWLACPKSPSQQRDSRIAHWGTSPRALARVVALPETSKAGVLERATALALFGPAYEHVRGMHFEGREEQLASALQQLAGALVILRKLGFVRQQILVMNELTRERFAELVGLSEAPQSNQHPISAAALLSLVHLLGSNHQVQHDALDPDFHDLAIESHERIADFCRELLERLIDGHLLPRQQLEDMLGIAESRMRSQSRLNNVDRQRLSQLTVRLQRSVHAMGQYIDV